MVGRGELRTLGARLRALRLAKGLSQMELARLVGRHQTAIGPYERDEYAPPAAVVERFAAILDTTPEYLSFGRLARRPGLQAAGRVAPGGELEPAMAPSPPRMLRAEAAELYEIADDSMSPVYRPGHWLLAARVEAEPWTSLFGRDALVRLSDGRELLRRLLPGPRPGTAALFAYSAGAQGLAEVAGARAVLGVIASDALASDTTVG